MTDSVRRLADAVLYEGYILWPYRRSATKNRQRWTFGGVYPPAHTRDHADDPCELRAEVELEAAAGETVDVTVRFLHVVERRIARAVGGARTFVDELTVGAERYLAWDEAVEREVAAVATLGTDPHRVPFTIDGGSSEEALGDTAAIVRTWRPLTGSIELSSGPAEPLVAQGHKGSRFRLTVAVRNETHWTGEDRHGALRQTFCSTHLVLHAPDGAFVSATESRCESSGLWPVLVGEDGMRDTMLAAPIILSDYPHIAPESPGDLFDSTEIDKLLILNVLALTPEEQEEMRASDPRAREILDRCATLSAEELMRLHGAIRDLRPAQVE
jgi:hypothetical protein